MDLPLLDGVLPFDDGLFTASANDKKRAFDVDAHSDTSASPGSIPTDVPKPFPMEYLAFSHDYDGTRHQIDVEERLRAVEQEVKQMQLKKAWKTQVGNDEDLLNSGPVTQQEVKYDELDAFAIMENNNPIKSGAHLHDECDVGGPDERFCFGAQDAPVRPPPKKRARTRKKAPDHDADFGGEDIACPQIDTPMPGDRLSGSIYRDRRQPTRTSYLRQMGVDESPKILRSPYAISKEAIAAVVALGHDQKIEFSMSSTRTLVYMKPFIPPQTLTPGTVVLPCQRIELQVDLKTTHELISILVAEVFKHDRFTLKNSTQLHNPWMYTTLDDAKCWISTMGARENSIYRLAGERHMRQSVPVRTLTTQQSNQISRVTGCMIGLLYVLDIRDDTYIRMIARIVHHFVFEFRYLDSSAFNHDIRFLTFIFFHCVITRLHHHLGISAPYVRDQDYILRYQKEFTRGVVRLRAAANMKEAEARGEL